MERRLFLGLVAAGVLAPALARASDDKRKKAGGAAFLPIKAVSGTSNRPGGRRGVMTVECGVDIPDPALRARAEASLPRLRAAFVQVVQIYAAGLPPGALPNVDFLARTLQRETDQVLGRPGARLLLGAVLIN